MITIILLFDIEELLGLRLPTISNIHLHGC